MKTQTHVKIVLGTLLLLWPAGGLSAAGPGAVDKPLIAYWSFDNDAPDACRDSSGNGNHASLDGKAPLAHGEGLFGKAIRLSGPHKLHMPGRPDFGKVEKITLSAWVMPTAFEQYNEIFRKEDADRRVLFSFQEHATVLSLGLNVNGYVECDAPIRPSQVLDGFWHHCAAVFDGVAMRVYLDGRQIGSLERSGKISAAGPAPGCIGSANGGECFQGAMDDLRIYKDALTPDEIGRLYQNGQASLERYRKRLERELVAREKRLGELNMTGKSFPEALANTRKSLVDKGILPNGPIAADAMKLLKARWSKDYHTFAQLTGMTPEQYLKSKDAAVDMKVVERLIGPLLEYMPLTDNQWERLSPEDRKKWQEVKALHQKYEKLKKLGAAGSSPEAFEVVIEVNRHRDMIAERPRTRERVAPYVTPSTPETRNLAAEEARDALRRDWLHQANGKPTAARIKSEIEWARQLAARIKTQSGSNRVDFAKELAELDALQKRVAAIKGADADLYFAVRAVKRGMMFKNPVVDFDKVLFVDMPFPAGSEWPHQTRHRLGYMAVPGARLLVLDGLSPGGKLKQLMPQPPLHGSFWRPDVSYDGKKVLFCFMPHNEKSFHLYEINADGTGLVQLTGGIYDDFDPIYLPDGHIIFSTTRGHTYVRCMPPTNAYPLARCDRDGRNIYLISHNNEPDYLPSVTNDGRIIYTRWEYTDKPLWRAQALWTVKPDGTQVNAFWGNQSVWPDLLKDARSIPGSRRIMFTGSAHHNWFSGSVGIIDPDRGFNFPNGLTKVTADVTWPESGNGPVDPIESPRYHPSGRYAAYYSPYPLSEKDFIVSANRGGKFVLYLMDTDGNRELIYEGLKNIFHAIPLKPRRRPPVLADIVQWPKPDERLDPKGGLIYSNNVYHGAPKELRGKARFLRVLTIEHKTYTYWHKRPYLSTGPVVSGVQSEGVKRILGTVPIEADGSVAFQAPSGIPLHFQVLDEDYRALQTMRSFTGVMPGERRGCLGCHELHSTTPEVGVSSSIAASREPVEITPPPWGEDTVSYARYVRPVLDKYCGKCHQGDGEGRKKFDMTPRPGRLGFDETYWILTGNPAWGKPYNKPRNPPPGFGIADMIMVEGYGQRDPVAYQTTRPMTRLSYKSRLIERASSGKHHDVKVDPVSLRRLIAWVDAMCPYRGDEEVRRIADPVFQGVDWLSIRPKIKNAPRIVRPGPVD